MQDTLNALINNGLAPELLIEVMDNLIKKDEFRDNDDKLGCIVQRSQMSDTASMRYVSWHVSHPTGGGPQLVTLEDASYLVLTDYEATQACKEQIKRTLYTYSPDYLSKRIRVDKGILTKVLKTGRSCNDALSTFIEGSCGLEYFAEDAIAAYGRGHFLSPKYDGELEYAGLFLYRVE